MIEKLLIVDDHAPTRQWLQSILSPVAREIRQSSDGSEAVKTFEEQRPDWVVMDIEMKPMDGLTAARIIKGRFPEARIVIMTNHQEASLRPAALQAGAVHFLLKEDLWQVRGIIEAQSTTQPLH